MSFAKALRHRVSIQRRPDESDDEGNPSGEWTEFATVWADIKILGGLESIKAGGATSVVKASIRIRSRNGITAGMRVAHKSDLYNILAVPPVLGVTSMDLICELTQ